VPPAQEGTMNDLKPAARRVQEALMKKGLDARVRHMPATTRTAQDAAAACGCEVGQIVKSLIFRGRDTGRPYLLLVSGTNRVDQNAVAAETGEALDRPDATYVRNVTGFAIGGIPPFAHTAPIATYIDKALLAYDVVWAAAGTPDAVFPIAPERLAQATGARAISVSAEP
jgi:prolyl-tRNA editing enzyme YbaK/EbsC (Cys-tRNA(Pro) deacylase)